MRRYEAVDPSGLHARPAADFVKAVARLNSDAVLIKGEKVANAKSILEVLALAINYGDEITLETQADEKDLDGFEGELSEVLRRVD